MISFPPDVLERISPEISLRRHLSSGIRPNLRNFDEFKSLDILSQSSNDLITSTFTQNGNTLIICHLTFGLSTCDSTTNNHQYTSIYPTVNIARGRSGAPTDEEMNLSQQMYEILLCSKTLCQDQLIITPSFYVNNELNYYNQLVNDDPEASDPPPYYLRYNIYAHFKVFSRSGPLLDSCYYTLLSSLNALKLPQISVKDNNYYINPDSPFFKPKLNLDHLPISSSLGIYELNHENLILCDLENESEESNINTKLNVITDGKTMSNFNLINGDLLSISKDDLKLALALASNRAVNLN